MAEPGARVNVEFRSKLPEIVATTSRFAENEAKGVNPVVDTVRVAVLVPDPAVGVCVVVTPEVELVLPPACVLVTLKVTVQLPLAGILIPEKLSAVAPDVKVLGVVPVQEP